MVQVVTVVTSKDMVPLTLAEIVTPYNWIINRKTVVDINIYMIDICCINKISCINDNDISD